VAALVRDPVKEAERLIAEGNRAEDAGRLHEACELYRRAVASAPAFPKSHLNLGIALEAMGDIAGAVACHEKALELDPAEPYANYNLGKLLYARGDLEQAQRRVAEALHRQPQFPEARIVLACVLRAQGKLEPAAAELEAALRERPADFAALFHYAGVLGELKRHEEAQAALERALAVDPENLDALYHSAMTLMRLGRDAEAEQALRRVIERAPQFVLAYRMLGSLLHRQGRIAEMLALCRSALQRAPGSFELESFELFLSNFSDEISDEALFERHRAFGERLEAAKPAGFQHSNPKQSERKLRIGYVSGDFNSHPVGLFTLPVLERHDRSRYEACCYSTSAKADEFTRRLSAHADAWRDVSALSEDELAETIHADRIDILVDLAGHSGISRLATFARQPAPVQAAWLGYLNTTGLTRIRYRITDAVSDPPGAEDHHTETLLRLARCQWCYRPFITVEHSPVPPSARTGRFTFGSFTQVAKISPSTRSLWLAILQGLPDARLVVLGNPNEELLRSFGSAASRVTLVPFLPLREYYAWFDAVDIALDTTPYSGGTTSCDALWMGVPVITAPGTRPASRSAASILAAVGLAEWIAPSAAQYVRRAVEFSKNLEVLSQLRVSLRARMQASPLMDEAGFTRDLEELYRQMWRRYCAQGV
jgi:predicted O-linked N-acetylglucosamine transferase (SPINDLY family)